MNPANAYFQYPDANPPGEGIEEAFLATGTEAEWDQVLAAAQARRFQAGEMVIREGESERALYILVAGSLEILAPGGRFRPQKRLQTVEPGMVIGEIAFFDGGPRSTSVRALSDGEVLCLRFDAFEMLAARDPRLGRAILLDLGRVLARRLRIQTR